MPKSSARAFMFVPARVRRTISPPSSAQPAKVTVVDHKFTWAQILPPEGSFSWVSKSYVKLDAANPGIGIIDGQAVRIWAGSEAVEPMRSTSLQAKLNDGDTVKFMGPTEAKGDYYKIVPPASARLWIGREFIKFVGPAPKAAVTLPPRPGSEKPAPATTPAVPVTPKAGHGSQAGNSGTTTPATIPERHDNPRNNADHSGNNDNPRS